METNTEGRKISSLQSQSFKPDSQCADVLHGERRVLPQLLVLLLGLAPGQDSVHGHRHQLDLNLLVRGRVVLGDRTQSQSTK